MKLLVVADLHYALPQFDWLVETASEYDGLIIAGDLLETSSMVDPGTQIVVVLKYLDRLRKIRPVVVCSGNHDLDAPGRDGEKRAGWMAAIKRLGIPSDGDTTFFGDLMVTVCPWWDGPLSQADIGRQLERAEHLREGPWLWVYHAPPLSSPVSWGGKRHFGDPALTGWIARHAPDIVVCGHVHEAPFVREGSWVDRIGDTWVFNAGKQIGMVPTTIVIETDAREAAWFSLDGAECVRLDLPLTRPVAQFNSLPEWMKG